MASVAEIQKRFKDQDVHRPPHWFGYRVVPSRIELWSGREGRLHERYIYGIKGRNLDKADALSIARYNLSDGVVNIFHKQGYRIRDRCICLLYCELFQACWHQISSVRVILSTTVCAMGIIPAFSFRRMPRPLTCSREQTSLRPSPAANRCTPNWLPVHGHFVNSQLFYRCPY